MEDVEATGAGTKPLMRTSLRWLAALAAALWIFAAATGIILTYHFEANDSLLSNDEIPLDYDSIERRLSAIEDQGGQAKVNWIWSTAGLPGRFVLNYNDPQGSPRMARIAGDGSVLLDSAEGEFTLLEHVRELHLALGAGKTGEWILAIAAILLLVHLALALKDAWPRTKSWRAVLVPDTSEGTVRRTDAWFRALTLWGAIPAFIVIAAAVVIFFEHQIEGPIGAPPISLPANPPTGEGVGFAAAVRAAEAAVPGSRFVGSPMPTEADASYKTWVNQPGEYFRSDGYGGSLVIVDANDASIRGAWPLQKASAPYKAIALPYPIHTGEIAGPLGRFLVLLTGLWLLVWSILFLRNRLRPARTRSKHDR
jgi:uncharacterized iron-regulated membrane protein